MSVMQRLLAAAVSVVLVLWVTIGTMRTQAQYRKFDPPREVVEHFMQLALIEHQGPAAVQKYMTTGFVDHDPHVSGSRESLGEYLQGQGQTLSQIKHLAVDGNLVVVHRSVTGGTADRALAVVDLYRVKDGQIIEHWNVEEPEPAHSSNPAPLF
jgi:predicted SnoaL-like aldol condensation-catalyzing enzyme